MAELNEHIRKLRSDYSQMELNENELEKNPILQFEKWLKEALEAKILEPHALTISTVNAEGKPSSRIVLLRDVTSNGFTFYTNYESKKGRDIEQSPYATMNFFWPQIERQVRVDGVLVKVPSAVSEDYFQSRPRESKIGAWASNQSRVLSSRKELEDKFIALSAQYPGDDVPRPPHWGGYLLQPTSVEFWQGRPNRLHDRIEYVLSGTSWLTQRLSP